MDLCELSDLIHNLGLDPTSAQLDLLFAEFKRDFIDTPFQINGLKLSNQWPQSKGYS